MARFEHKGSADLVVKLSKLGERSAETAKKAVATAAGIVADKIRANLRLLPEDRFRLLKTGETFRGVPPEQKKDLLDSLGITKIGYTQDGMWNARVGFHGYGTHPTRKYPKGVPNQLLARSVESGSSVREKTPFSRPAVNSTKKTAQDAMQNVINESFDKL